MYACVHVCGCLGKADGVVTAGAGVTEAVSLPSMQGLTQVLCRNSAISPVPRRWLYIITVYLCSNVTHHMGSGAAFSVL